MDLKQLASFEIMFYVMDDGQNRRSWRRCVEGGAYNDIRKSMFLSISI